MFPLRQSLFFGTAPPVTTVDHHIGDQAACFCVNLNRICSFSKSEWPYSLPENCALVRQKVPQSPSSLLVNCCPRVGEVWMDKPGCCSIALGQFRAHKRSQGSVKARSSLNSRPSNPFVLSYQNSLFCSVCDTHSAVWRGGGACQMSVLRLGAIKPVVMMKECICHLFLLLWSN